MKNKSIHRRPFFQPTGAVFDIGGEKNPRGSFSPRGCSPLSPPLPFVFLHLPSRGKKRGIAVETWMYRRIFGGGRNVERFKLITPLFEDRFRNILIPRPTTRREITHSNPSRYAVPALSHSDHNKLIKRFLSSLPPPSFFPSLSPHEDRSAAILEVY